MKLVLLIENQLILVLVIYLSEIEENLKSNPAGARVIENRSKEIGVFELVLLKNHTSVPILVIKKLYLENSVLPSGKDRLIHFH